MRIPTCTPTTLDPALAALEIILHVHQFGTTAGCTYSQLIQADRYYALAYQGIGQDDAAQRQAERIAATRRLIQGEIRRQDALLATIANQAAEMDAAELTAAQAGQPGAPDAPLTEDQDPIAMAVRMMRAALQIIQGPQPGDQDDQGNGGSRVPRRPHPPTNPPSNQAIALPRANQGGNQVATAGNQAQASNGNGRPVIDF